MSESDIKLDVNKNKELINPFSKDELINFDVIKDMLSLALLVYDFNTTFKVELLDNKSYNLNNLDINKIKLNKEKKVILENILSKSPNCELYKFYDLKSGTQVGITISHKQQRICVIFRGSNELIDWINDFLICKIRLEDNKYVHYGFYKSLFNYNLFNDLTDNLKMLIKEFPEYELFITGHSLGGGLATLFSYLICDKIDKNITLISFASPRVGNKEWKDDFENKKNLRHYRCINRRDIVTAVPYFFYYHVGNCILINNESIIEYKVSSLYDDFSNFFINYNPFDHFIENYYNNLITCKWQSKYNN